MSTVDLKQQINENAGKIRLLHSRIHDSFSQRDKTKAGYQKWEDACKEFHQLYDQLSFPGGYNGALDRITAGDPQTVEAAICFLEARPYFFRSGYMFTAILKKAKRAPLSEDQNRRLQQVLVKRDLWRLIKSRESRPLQ